MKFCSNCGAALEDNIKFCTECGTPVSTPTPAEKAAPATWEESYVPPAYNTPVSAPAVNASAAGKPANKRVRLFALVGIAALLMIAVIAAFFGTKGGKADPNLGLYNGVSCKVEGFELGAEDEWVELKSGGSVSLCLMGEKYNGRWSLEGEKFTITQHGDEFTGTLKDGIMTIDFAGMLYTFQKEGVSVPSASDVLPAATAEVPAVLTDSGSEPPVSEPTGAYSWWNGEWYGWWVIWDAEGEFADAADSCWDICARIEVYDDNTGYVALWDTDGSSEEILCDAEVSFGPGTTERGCMISEYGWFMDDEIGHADWIVDPGASVVSSFDDMICIEGIYTDPENSENTIVYYIFLRPWGMDWEDVRNADTSEMPYSDMMPLDYDDWYLPKIQSGVTQMPDSFTD